MTEWIYLFTYNPSFPPPKEEIATLAALSQRGQVEKTAVQRAMTDLGFDPDKSTPSFATA